jgi:hypothetical protein
MTIVVKALDSGLTKGQPVLRLPKGRYDGPKELFREGLIKSSSPRRRGSSLLI